MNMNVGLQNVVRLGFNNVGTEKNVLACHNINAFEKHYAMTGVRFLDSDGLVTNDFLLKTREVKMNKNKIGSDFVYLSIPKKIMKIIPLFILSRKMVKMQKDIESLVLKQLEAAIQKDHEVGIECPDGSYRLLENDEREMFLESVRRARDAREPFAGVGYINVLKPTDLLSDKNDEVIPT